MFDKNAYLKRVGLTHAPANTEEGLKQLHHAQFYSIPFENFEIQLGREIPLDEHSLFDQLVHHKRGGYCFQLNGLMAMALSHFGFTFRPLLARVHLKIPPSSRTHRINCVTINGRNWIIDVGFNAGGLRSPIPLETGTYPQDSGMAFKLHPQEPWGWMFETLDNGQWKKSYSFDLQHVTPQDIELGNFYASHSPNTHFTTSRVAGIPFENGRITLNNYTVTETIDNNITRTQIEPGEAYMELLYGRFGIKLDTHYANLKPV